MLHVVEVDLNGRKLTLETGKMAKQANGAVIVRSGESVVLVTACSDPGAKARAQTSSPSRWITASTPTPPDVSPAASSSAKAGLTEKEILTSRLIDRPIRPLFPEGYSHETQVIAHGAVGRSGARSGHAGASSARAPRWRFPIFRSITSWPPCASAWWTAS